MTRNMGALDRGVRAFVVAPVAIVVVLILGAGTVGGIIRLVVAGVMIALAAMASATATFRASAG